MIATNKYVDLWKNVATDLDRIFSKSSEWNVSIHLFTDQNTYISNWVNSSMRNIQVFIHEIPNYKWPDATLLRYRLITCEGNKFDEDVLMYLDSDMQVNKNFMDELKPEEFINGLAFVKHPGFFRPELFELQSKEIITYLKLRMKDLKYLIYGQFNPGTWETNKSSAAFVPAKDRKIYVHGAVWFGRNSEFKEMSRILSERVNTDLDNNYIAIWHDESHLNWYFANHDTSILDVRFSNYRNFSLSYKKGSFIETVEKNSQVLRENDA